MKSNDPLYKRAPNAPGDQTKKFIDKPGFRGNVGRVAPYFYSREKDPHHLEVATRMINILDHDTLPQIFLANEIADRIQFLMDVYHLTKDRKHLDKAIYYADLGIAGLWRGGLFARRVGDPYYESKDEIGTFVTGLLRLHLALNGTPKDLQNVDWSD